MPEASSWAAAPGRSLDLRRETAERFAAGEPLGTLGGRERWRVTLDAIDRPPPLGGIVHLTWGDELRVRAVEAAERIALLAAHRGLRVPSAHSELWLSLAAVPWFELSRPKSWEELPRVVDELRALAES
jgi:hypothetical protein